MKISLELVPSSTEKLIKEATLAKEKFKSIEVMNIPDLLRFELRSWDACSLIKTIHNNTIPHIRAIDFDLDKPLPIKKSILDNNINEVLILTGDVPQEMNRKIYHTNCIDFIKKFKEELPNVKIYGAIDPYRNSIKKEYMYVEKKINAGVDGFFTQPFFDIRFMDIYNEVLKGVDVYFGVSPVLTDNAASYWKTKNNVIFPNGFNVSLDWNIDFAKKVIKFCDKNNRDVYFMPIRMNIEEYLNEIL